MEKIVSNELCTGCTACMNICPKQAIKMMENSDGFKYPVIDKEKCINCELCIKTCPVLNTQDNNSLNECYVGYNKDNEIRFNSSSGGIFSLIANYVLEQKGIIIGAAFNNENKLEHIAVEKNKDLRKLMGSKYLQSDLNDIYKYVRDNIKNRKILFVGTPCQVAGMKAFLKNDYDNLICVDLFCHGVPSPKLFFKYVQELEKEYNSSMINYNFRDKCTGWKNYSNVAEFNNNRMTQSQGNNSYMKLFLSNVSLRESCFNCNFKIGNKYSDITIGDFWGIEKYYPKMDDDFGTSAIIINTVKGKKVFDSLKNMMIYEECKISEIIDYNPCLKESVIRPRKRNKFFKDLDKYSINKLEKKYVLVPFSTKIKNVFKQKKH